MEGRAGEAPGRGRGAVREAVEKGEREKLGSGIRKLGPWWVTRWRMDGVSGRRDSIDGNGEEKTSTGTIGSIGDDVMM